MRKLTALRLCQEHVQIVRFGGEIARELWPWIVSYTLSEEGWVDLDRKESFTDVFDAHRRIYELMGGELAKAS